VEKTNRSYFFRFLKLFPKISTLSKWKLLSEMQRDSSHFPSLPSSP
jgi:hypothetical protein